MTTIYCGRQAHTPTHKGTRKSNQRGNASSSGQASQRSNMMMQVLFNSKKTTSPVVRYLSIPYMSRAISENAIQPIFERIVTVCVLAPFFKRVFLLLS